MAGAGAIGQWLGARLLSAGHDVTLLLRPRHKEAIDHGGLHVRGRTDFHGRPACVTRAEDAHGPFDAVFLTCKAYDTLRTGALVVPLVAEDGVLASLQNGLGNGEKLAGLAGRGRVAVCLTSHGIMLEAPGHVFHAGTGPTHVGPASPAAAEAAHRAESLLRDAGLEPVWHVDITAAVWTKAAVNAGLNPTAALAGVRNGAVLHDAALLARAEALVDEVYALSRAAGVPLPDVRASLRATLAATEDNKCSMLQDVEARRPTEIEQITGWFARLGRRLGFPMYASEDVLRDVKALEASYLGEDLSLRLTREEAEAWPGA